MFRMFLGCLLFIANLIFLVYLWNCLQTRVPVLCFHRVIENRDPLHLWIAKDQFLEILDLIEKKGFITMLPGEMPDPHNPSVILSFDDGTKDHLDTVIPLLNSRGMKGLFFWITGPMEGWDALRLEKLKTISKAHQHGSHSKTHYPILTGLETSRLNRLKMELEDSRSFLKGLFGQEVLSFAFPRGEVDAGGAALAHQYYPYLFSVEYDYFYPGFEKKVHGRYLVLKEQSLQELEDYLDESQPLRSPVFPLTCCLIVLANLFFWLRKKPGNPRD